MDINERIARRLSQLRSECRLTIDALSARSGVSRAMISRIERGECSPTATLLNNLAIGLGVLLPEIFGPSDYRESRLRLRNPVVSRKGQPEWVDPVTGYRRRTLTPSTTPSRSGGKMQLNEMLFPAGARVIFENSGVATSQQIWMLVGQLEIRVGDEITMLGPGDCMALARERPVMIHNTAGEEARCVAATLNENLQPVAGSKRPRSRNAATCRATADDSHMPE
ncbi:MAG: XRE family transcriptional regulator [Pseudomonadota bacterium]